jgi:hypothetical protein
VIAKIREHALPVLVSLAISGSLGWLFLEALDTAKVKAVTSIRLDSQNEAIKSQDERTKKLEEAFSDVARAQAVTSAVLEQLAQEARNHHNRSKDKR